MTPPRFTITLNAIYNNEPITLDTDWYEPVQGSQGALIMFRRGEHQVRIPWTSIAYIVDRNPDLKRTFT